MKLNRAKTNAREKEKERNARKMVMRQIPYFRWHSVFSCSMSLVLQLIALIPVIIMQQIIDEWIPGGNTYMILLSIVSFCMIPVISTVLSAIYRYYLAMICRKTGLYLSIKGFRNLVYQPLSYFDKHNSSELASYCRSEAMKYVSFWLMDIPQLIASVVSGLIVLLYLLYLNWIIAIFLLAYIPFAFFPSNYFAKQVQTLTKRIIRNNAKMNQLISDSFKGIKFVKALLLEKHQIAKLKTVNADSVSIWSKVALYDNMSGIWIHHLSDSLFTSVVFGIIAYFIVLGRNSIGQLVIVLNYSGKVLEVFKQLIRTNYDLKTKLGEYDKLFSILAMQCDEVNGGKDFTFHDKIVYEDVTFSYDEERGAILDDFNLTIYKGEWVGIVGASGTGKTTIFDLALKFYSPQKGRILADGEDLGNISTQSLRNKITRVSQDIFLFPGTIRENLLLANQQATQGEMNHAIDIACLRNFIDSLPDGLDTDIGEDGLLLSGGERQRLALAQGMLRQSEIILLDEVTANVDRDAEREIRMALKGIMCSQKLTIIAISHRVDFLQDSDRIIELESGKVVRNTTYEQYIQS